MKTKKLHTLLLIMASVIMFACNTQPNRADGDGDGDTLGMDNDNRGVLSGDQNKDNDFILEASSSSMMEIELAQFAEQNAQHPRVRNFASMIVRDHTKAMEDLKALANSKNINLPTVMEDDHRDKMRDIQEKRGLDFDREYMSEMINAHENDIDKFTKHAEEGNDSDLKAFAANTLPVLLMHQDSAKRINDAIK